MSDLAYKISVMQAALEGKPIQGRKRCSDDHWYTVEPAWEWKTYEYRIAPEPRKPREFFVSVSDDGVAFKFDEGDERLGYEKVRVREVIEE